MDVNNPLAVCTYCHSTIRVMPKPMGIPAESADGIHLNEIAQALNRMLHRTNEDAFVIFEERTNRRFVQFAGSTNSSLLLDLPSQTLSPQEMQRAIVLFSSFGAVGPDIHSTYTDTTSKIVASQQVSFNLDLGKDVQLAAHIALTVFQQIYRCPTDFQLVIAEN
jgi:hypothetical protein